MRFVAVRSLMNQATLMRHKTREMLVSQRTQLVNGLRGHLTEVGVIAAQGPRHARELAERIEACDETIPFEVCEALAPLVVQLRNLDEAIARLERTIAKLAQKDETARRLMTIPGFGPIPASAMAATIQDTSRFAGPREFAAYLGLTPKQNSSGGKQKLGRISKMGNRNLRKLLVVSAHAVLFHRKSHTDPLRMWGRKLTEKKPFAQFGPTRSPNNDIDASSTCVLFLLLPFGRAIFLTEGFQATIRLPEVPPPATAP